MLPLLPLPCAPYASGETAEAEVEPELAESASTGSGSAELLLLFPLLLQLFL